MAIAFVFPGQGSQAVGMGKALADAFPAARQVFDEVDEALGEKLSSDHVGGSGRDADADRERPAGADGGLARGDAGARDRGGRRSRARRRAIVAGHSLGEYSALAAAGSLSARRCGAAVADPRPGHAEGGAGRRRRHGGAARPRIRRRPRRSPPKPRKAQVCQVANDNGGGQVVVSGDKAAVERAVEIAKAQGREARHAAPGLRPVPLRADAAGGRRDGGGARRRDDPHAPAVPLVANVTAAAVTDPAEIARRLVEQVTGTVRWRECVAYMAGQGVTDSTRSAPARCSAASSSASPTAPPASAIGTPEDIEAFAAARARTST